MTSKLLPVVLLAPLCLAACQALSVYTIDLPQGNPITQQMAAKLKPGMTPSQVRYVLGSPMITDTLNANRWDYAYRFRPGTYARQAGMAPIRDQQLTLYFDDGKLARIVGAETLPTQAQILPPSKDGGLRAEPL